MKTNVRAHFRHTRHGRVRVVRHVRTVPCRVLRDYAGMNREAAKAMGFKPLPGRETVLVNATVHGDERRKTVIHEEVEAALMRRRWPYWKAHNAALRAEKVVTDPDHDHLPNQAFDRGQMRLGVLTEYEHTRNPDEARRIAKEHLLEDPKYYTKLRRAGL